MKAFNPMEVKDLAVQWIRDWFEENGPGCNAVLGISKPAAAEPPPPPPQA